MANSHWEPSFTEDIEQYEQRARAFLVDRGVQKRCSLEVHRNRNWFVLDGRVDSYGTKIALVNLVPKIEGARWVVDRVHIGEVCR